MRRPDCFFEKVSHLGVGMALMFIGLGLSVMGATVLTMLGFLVAAPVFILAAFYLLMAESPECEMVY